MKEIKLKAKEEHRINKGHYWIFSNELEQIDKTIAPGSIVKITDYKGGVLGLGFFNPRTLIAARLLTKGAQEELGKNFIFERLDNAFAYRKQFGVRKFGRMCYGEADGLPGLVVDRYGDYLVAEILTAGMELLKEDITASVKKIFKPKGIKFKNDSAFRELEGLSSAPETIGQVPEEVEIEENKAKFIVSLQGSQKTGFYFDQRDNRAFLKPYFKDKIVLDLYSYSGSFGINAALNGAAAVWGADSSAAAVELAKRNAELNGVSAVCQYHRDDAERLLSAMGKNELPQQPDMVLLDPPAFVKNRKALPQAVNLYVKLNRMALAGLKEGGMLATSTCSHHISREIFMDIIKQAAAKAGKKVNLIELRGQAKDHPALIGMPETEYLHFALLEVR
ncbi:MAG: class I SAM-dependent rRNA methyltransferase [Elusimicrobiota bacterium]|jgi:23S rRNA (cytosine1962-C5)-methyltransferase|nr:class I SAM-dependent rRNA methyltransferase [Elusimicrobiota bacterium]